MKDHEIRQLQASVTAKEQRLLEIDKEFSALETEERLILKRLKDEQNCLSIEDIQKKIRELQAVLDKKQSKCNKLKEQLDALLEEYHV